MNDIERHVQAAHTVAGDTPGLLDKLLALEVLLAARIEQALPRETAAISKELRECWQMIEVLTAGDDDGAGADDELSERRDRVAAARRAAAEARTGP